MSGVSGPSVGIAIPVWRGAEFVGETLESVLGQRYRDFRVFISVDGADEASVAAIKPHLCDPRVTMIVQPARLGWVKNSAAALTAAISEGPAYACLQPHDDLIEPDYLGALVEAAESNPNAAVVYSDIAVFGAWEGTVSQPSIMGSPLARQVSLLLDHWNAVAFRGLTRLSALRSVEMLSGNGVGDFAADTVWMARLATAGDLLRVARLLYRKRVHQGSTHAEWYRWPRERKIAAWTEHCVDMLGVALKVAASALERRLLIKAAKVRLLRAEDGPGPFGQEMSELSAKDRRRMIADFNTSAAALLKAARARERKTSPS